MWHRSALFFIVLSALACGAPAVADSHEPLENIRDAVRHFLLDNTADYRVEPIIEVRRIDPRLRLARCGEVLEPFLPSGRELLGHVTIGVRCSGPTPWSLYVQASVQVFDAVVIAARPLTRGRVLEESDVILSTQDLARLGGGYIAEPEEVIGMVMTRFVSAGVAITPHHLAPPEVVRRGERVTITAQTTGIEVHVEGEALQSGAMGQVIRVRNLSSKRELEGTVVAPGRVEVRL